MADLDLALMPRLLQWSLPMWTWRGRRTDNSIYLTFDDGPTAEVTESVLDCLSEHHAKATFFMLGSQVEKYPEIARRVRDAGHAIGNHGYGHLNGWKTSTAEYVEDFRRGRCVLEQQLGISADCFRPPYGRIGPFQALQIMRSARIIMWEINSQDYRTDRSDADILGHIQRFVRQGSIILMHDNELTAKRATSLLSQILPALLSRGFKLRGLSLAS